MTAPDTAAILCPDRICIEFNHNGTASVISTVPKLLGTMDYFRADVVADLRAENERLLCQIRAIAAAYDRDVPMRTADWHGTDCDCLRCNIDNARAALAQKGGE